MSVRAGLIAKTAILSGPLARTKVHRARDAARPGSPGHEPTRTEWLMAREITQAIVDGILVGGVYALMAVGLTLIFGVLDIINIAQGVLVILGAYLSYSLFTKAGIDPFLGLLITIPGDVHRRRGDPLGVHQQAARRRADVDDAARHLRGGADHRGHPLQDLRRGQRAALAEVREQQRARLQLLHRLGLHLGLHPRGRARRGRLRAALPDEVRAQRPRRHAGRRRRPASWASA